MNTLAEYAAAIEAAKGLSHWDARVRLRALSVEIRRKLWRDRDAARALASDADNAATAIEAVTPNMSPTSPLPRFAGFTSGGLWHPPIN